MKWNAQEERETLLITFALQEIAFYAHFLSLTFRVYYNSYMITFYNGKATK